jgi:molecular chaperone GrpE
MMRSDDSMTRDDQDTPTEAAADPSAAPAGEGHVPAPHGAGSDARQAGDHDPALDEVPSDDGATRAELDELKDRHLRLAAEFENFRKRTRDELTGVSERAKAAFIGSLLDVLDDFQRVHEVDTQTATAASVLEGVAMVQRKLDRVLAEAGLETLDPTGQAFNPETMEAVLRVPTEDEELDDQVAQVFQPGARFRGHLVRPARVSVHKAD